MILDYLDESTLELNWAELERALAPTSAGGSGPEMCGAFNDVNILGCDEPDLPETPFDEFPRISSLTDDQLAVVAAVAERYIDLHHSGHPPVTATGENPSPPTGVYAAIATARARSSRLVLLRSPATQASVTLRVGPHGVVLVAIATTDSAAPGFGFVEYRFATIDDCIQWANEMAADGTLRAASWNRQADQWHETRSLSPLPTPDISSYLASALASD